VKQIDHSATRRYAARAIHRSGSGAVANLARAYLALSKERDELRERLLLLLKKIDETLER
jgi:hypothetical protein